MNMQTVAAYLTIACVVIFLIRLFWKSPQKAKTVIKDAESVVGTLQPLLATTPLAGAVNVLDVALQAAGTGVRYAEQLFKNDSTVDRKKIATQYVANAAKTLGIEITPQVAHLLDGAIEAAVLALPPTQAQTEQAITMIDGGK